MTNRRRTGFHVSIFLSIITSLSIIALAAIVAVGFAGDAEEPVRSKQTADTLDESESILKYRPAKLSPAELPIVEANPTAQAMAAEMIEIRRRLQGGPLLGAEFDGFATGNPSDDSDGQLFREQLLRLDGGRPGRTAASDKRRATGPPPGLVRTGTAAERAQKLLRATAAELAVGGFTAEALKLRDMADQLATKTVTTSRDEARE